LRRQEPMFLKPLVSADEMMSGNDALGTAKNFNNRSKKFGFMCKVLTWSAV